MDNFDRFVYAQDLCVTDQAVCQILCTTYIRDYTTEGMVCFDSAETDRMNVIYFSFLSQLRYQMYAYLIKINTQQNSIDCLICAA